MCVSLDRVGVLDHFLMATSSPQQCLVLQPLLSQAVFLTLLSVAWVPPTMVVPTLTSLRSQFCLCQARKFCWFIVHDCVFLSWHASFYKLDFFTINHNRTGVSLHVYWMLGEETLIYMIFARAIVILLYKQGRFWDLSFLLHTIKLSDTTHADKLNRSLQT